MERYSTIIWSTVRTEFRYNTRSEITLAWNDEAGSATSSQSDAKLINDLDLIVLIQGNQYNGNNFNGGYSVIGVSSDTKNNMERISIPSGSLTNSGQWLVQVIHRGGVDQISV